MRLPFIINTLTNILLVYINIFLLYPAFLNKKLNHLKYWSVVFIVLLLGGLLKAVISQSFCIFYFSKISDEVPFGASVAVQSFILGLLLLISVLYCFIKGYLKSNLTNLRLSEEKSLMELKYLKAQINPHFLFNTLNNLYSTAIKNNDDDTATGIAKLSQIMRYMLKDVNEKTIALDKEIEYLKSYIELEKMRFSETDDIDIRFDIKGCPSDVFVPPFLFIGFVENAFKYGIYYKSKSFIFINFEIEEHSFSFAISNSVHQTYQVNKNGVGLKNVRERLQLAYPGKYNLQITDNGNVFNVLLSVNVN
jgi:LytS/YehU family sensor histidine kinase